MKIAFVGTEDASHDLAPWDDPSWQIWATSPNSRDYPRVDRHFEVHSPDLLRTYISEKTLVEYFAHLNRHPNVSVLRRHPALPKADLLNWMRIVDEFGPYFISSSVCWMLGEAILMPGRPEAKEFGLFGIDCSAKEEYAVQRPGVQFFLWEAEKRGVKLTVPPESDILRPAPIYGLREFSPMFRKNWAKKRQLTRMVNEAEAAQYAATEKALALRGALDQVDYYVRTWDEFPDNPGDNDDPKRSDRKDKART